MQVANNYYGYSIMEQHTKNAVRQNHNHQKNEFASEFAKKFEHAQKDTAEIDDKVKQLFYAQSTQQETEQETTQPTPGNNSAAIMDSVSRNFDWLANGAHHSDERVIMRIRVLGEWEGLSVMRNHIPHITGVPVQNGTIREDLPQPPAIQRETLSDKIFQVLSKNGITLSPYDNFNISVDKYCNVTVTGDDAKKTKAIEKLLNTPGSENWGSLLQRENLDKDIVWGVGMTKEQAIKQDKMLLENYLINASGGKVSLNDLYLSDNGRIMGLPPELDKLINSIEPAWSGMSRQEIERQVGNAYDAAKKYNVYDVRFNENKEIQSAFNAGDKEKAVKLVAETIYMQDTRFCDIKSALADVLKKGVNNIPDMNANYVLGNGGIEFA
ncbi:MAG: hypothetical protein LBC64_06345 [Fibromonadaceae bacterium]|jgi:hypothetical protein|nr:hypothetical protein [Fibromonadaceae bacterium]